MRLVMISSSWSGQKGIISAPTRHAEPLIGPKGYPTLADEIRQMQEEIPQPRVTIDTVTFQGAIHLPEPIAAQIAAPFEHANFDSDSDWIDAFQEAVQGAWQQHGYFYTKVSARTPVLSGNSTDQHVSVTVHVDEGLQYHLGEIQFTNANEFPPAEMRKPIKPVVS
jgi:outer membrane translocation and assembly module TamA